MFVVVVLVYPLLDHNLYDNEESCLRYLYLLIKPNNFAWKEFEERLSIFNV